MLHTNSGVTLTDTKGRVAAEKFVRAVRRKCRMNPKFRASFARLSWEKACRYHKGKPEPECEEIFLALEFHSSLADHVQKSVTKNERYLYPPEPII